MHPLFSVRPFFPADGFIHEFITSLLNTLLFPCLCTHIQWKNLSPICPQWKPAECGGSEAGPAGHS